MEKNNINMEKIINQIFAITSRCLLIGYLPTEKEKLMNLFKDVNVTREEIIQLAKDNKLKWVYDRNNCYQSIEEYNKSMNQSLAHYLS